MRALQTRTIIALHHEVRRVNGDSGAAASEVLQFQSDERYRQGLCEEFARRHRHWPSWDELVKFFFHFALHRARVLRLPLRQNRNA